MDAANIYVADTDNNRVQIFQRGSLAYRATLQSWKSGQLELPGDVAVDRAGNIFVVDTLNHRVQKFDRRLRLLMTLGVPGQSGSDTNHFTAPSGVTVDQAGNIYVADTGNNRIQVFGTSGAYRLTISGSSFSGHPGGQNGLLNQPYGVEVDAQGNVYIADTGNFRIQVFTRTGSQQNQP